MIDQKLSKHPASKLAAACLEKLRRPPSTAATPLLRLAIYYLDSLQPEDFHGANHHLLDLREEAHRLAAQADQTSVASLFLPDQGQFREDLREVPQNQEWPILSEHLDLLEAEMRQESSIDGAARLLAENLHNSLQHLSPNFGRQAQSS